jgi:hypothetical protein
MFMSSVLSFFTLRFFTVLTLFLPLFCLFRLVETRIALFTSFRVYIVLMQLSYE